jgi:hypothetical protein
MTLYVSFEEFPATARRFSEERRAYLQALEGGVLITLAHPSEDRILAANTGLPLPKVRHVLEDAGFLVNLGCWGPDPDVSPKSLHVSEAYVGAVAYESSDHRPGVWVDAFPSVPTQVTVIHSMFEEFLQTGEAPEMSFEEFVRQAKPTAVVVSPREIAHFIEGKPLD